MGEKYMKEFMSNFFINSRKLWYKMLIYNKNISIISNDCCAGCIYHDIGARFLSPTINLYINNENFFKYLSHIKEYNELELQEKPTNEKYPVGILKSEFLDPIEIHFIHYSSFNEAKKKWDDRKSRIN